MEKTYFERLRVARQHHNADEVKETLLCLEEAARLSATGVTAQELFLDFQEILNEDCGEYQSITT